MAIAVFGLDGALVDRRRRMERIAAMSAPDWDAEREDFSRDEPQPEVVDVLRALYASGHRIVLLTDRPERLSRQTKGFLADWNIPYHELFYRHAGDDTRAEEEVEMELFEHAALPQANVLGVFHDNPALIAALRKRGVTCFEVCAKGLL